VEWYLLYHRHHKAVIERYREVGGAGWGGFGGILFWEQVEEVYCTQGESEELDEMRSTRDGECVKGGDMCEC